MPAALGPFRHVLLDFDGTLCAIEGIDELARVAAARLPEGPREELASRVAALTEAAMRGELSFGQSLAQRLALVRPRPEDVEAVRELAAESVDPTASEAIARLQARGMAVHVLSGGFRGIVEPVAATAGIPAQRVHCNALVPAGDGTLGLDAANPLAADHGKAMVAASLAARAECVMVGDGATDLEVRQRGGAAAFVACVSFRRREEIVAAADAIIESLAELPEILA